jgi:hypothetical protein
VISEMNIDWKEATLNIIPTPSKKPKKTTERLCQRKFYPE